jgi:exodeoxyribonuclease V alpha subunit
MTLGHYFADKIFPEGEEEQKNFLASLFDAAVVGHLCLEVDLPLALPERLVSEDPLEIFPKKPICRHGNRYYLQRNWVYETRLITHLKRLLQPIESLPMIDAQLLTEEQLTAVKMSLTHRLTLITGGPGTGKTYTAKRIVESFLQAKPEGRVLLAAPTGKAAARLESSIANAHVATLHAHLGRDLREETPLLEADLILVDECSMADAVYFSSLFAAVPEGTRLVLIGDGDQLPPVESGSLFADLVELAEESGRIPYVRLTHCLRSDQKQILALAKAAREGNSIPILKAMQPIDFWKEIDAHFSGQEDFDQFRILSCIRKGPFGVDTLNEAIFHYFWERMQPGEFLTSPILITKNDPRTGLMNGDTGILRRRYPDLHHGEAIFSKITLPAALLPPHELAYVLSVHKSQGSEYENLILLVPTGSETFGREVLYTAITRAKSSLRIDGDPEVVRAALNRSSRRVSGLKERGKRYLSFCDACGEA